MEPPKGDALSLASSIPSQELPDRRRSGEAILQRQILSRKPPLGLNGELKDGPDRMRSGFLVLVHGGFQ